MANDTKNDDKKREVDNDFIDEESNGKFILFIVLSILVVLGLIIGSVYYFNRDVEEKPSETEKNPVEIIENPDLEEDKENEEQEPEEEETYPVFDDTVANVDDEEDEPEINEPTEEPEEKIIYTIMFFDEKDNQIGETQKVEDLSNIVTPEVPVVEGYEGEWVSECDENNVCRYKPKYKKILVAAVEDATYDINLNGSVIEVSGTVIESGRAEADFAESGYRSYVKVKFIAPENVTKEMLETMSLSIKVEGVDGGINENGIGILDSTPEEIENGVYYFYYTIAIDEVPELALPEITVNWGNGNDNAYTIDTENVEITSYSEYIGITKPTIDDTNGDGVLTGAGDVTYEIDAELTEDDHITNINIDGEVNNYEEKTGIMEVIGLDEFNNILTLKFTAPSEVTDFSNLTVTTEQNTYSGPGVLDGENYFYMYQAVDPGTTNNPKIIIDWDGEEGELEPETYIINTDTIKLTPNKELDSTVSSNENNTYNQNLVQNHDAENIIEVTGDIEYDEEKDGYLIETTFKPIEGTTVDKDKITVTNEKGEDVYNADNLVEDENGNISYNHTQIVQDAESTSNVTIDWNGTDVGGNISYEYDVSNANLIPNTNV